MPEPSRSLPPHPSLEQQKKLAKELLKALRAGDADAHERVRRHLPDKQRITLADAQFVLAREYGFESWAKLKAHIASGDVGAIAESLREACARAFAARDAAAVRELLTRHPAARALIDAPIFPFDSSAPGQDGGTVLHCAAWEGSVACIEVALRHPGVRALIERPDPTHGSTALGWCCHGARHCANPHGDYPAVARLLLEAGARPGPNLHDAPADVLAVLGAHGGGAG